MLLREAAPARVLSAGVLATVVAFALLGSLVWPDPVAQDLARSLEGPSPAEPFGFDHLGRSTTARLAAATRLSLALAVLGVTAAAVVGTLAGVLAAWRRGWADVVLRAVSEILVALPALLVVLLASAAAGGSLWALFGGLALAQWVEYFRVARARSAAVLGGRAVEAAGLLRLGPGHVVRRHLWPDLRPVLTTMATFGVGTSVLAISTLGFVSVGVQPPTPELGLMITEAFPFWSEAPRMVLAPVVVLGAVLVGLLGLRGEES